MTKNTNIPQDEFCIVREICVDAGHRVPFHGSKCRNVHGHRYCIQALCRGVLQREGAQKDMILDFAFLKEEMMSTIHEECDHTLILWSEDPMLVTLAELGGLEEDLETLQQRVKEEGFTQTDWLGGKLYLINSIPTAECLARHWYFRLADRVTARSSGLACLFQIRVWETPNCRADFPIVG